MKTFYKLEENLELPNENFIIKKGTLAYVNNLFDVNENTPTVLGINFSKINGTYNINEPEFEKLIAKNSVTRLSPKFTQGECVKSNTHGNGIVADYWYDDFIEMFTYAVDFSGAKFTVAEKFLSHC